MTLIKWRILVLIEKLKKVTPVAQELGLKQPTVTFHMKSMEEEWGTRLFEVKTGRILLSEAGRRLHRHALRMLAVQEEAECEMQLFGGSRKRISLRCGLPCRSMAAALAADLLQPLGYGIELLPEDHLASSSADIVFAEAGSALSPAALSMPPAELRLALSPLKTAAAGGGSASAALESGLPWIAPPPGSSLRSSILAWAAGRGLSLEEGQTVPDTALAASLAAAGLGMAFLPVWNDSRMAAASDAVSPDSSRLNLLPLGGTPLYEIEVQLSQSLPAEASQAFRDWLSDRGGTR